MASHQDADLESVVVLTPTEGSVRDGPIVVVNADGSIDSDVVKVDKEKSDDAADGDKEKTEEEKEEEKIIVGMVCDTKNLYQKWDNRDKYTWTETYPDDLEEAAENEQTMKYAILVRNKKSYDSRKKLEVDSVVIQSPLLKNALHDILEGYPGVTTKLRRLTFAAPFRAFVHRWARFTEALVSDKYDADTKAHIKLLHDVLYAELKDVISAVSDYIKNEVVTYEHIWTIFQPGATVFTTRFGHPVAARLEQGNYGEHNRYGPCFVLEADRVEWDGSKFGFASSQHIVRPFIGTVPIADLDIYPIEFHADAEEVRHQLRERGRLFEQLAGYNFRAYSGPAIFHPDSCSVKQVVIEGRIVLDAHAYGKFSMEGRPSLSALTKVDALRDAQVDEDDGDAYARQYWSGNDEPAPGDLHVAAGGASREKVPLTDEQALLCSPMVKGYSLKAKKWLEFYISQIRDVVFSERAFDQLVLPEGHKELILAFSQSQVRHKDAFDDGITGKGKGMIMLLSGSPGVGKTLTAEAVAEAMRVPLYVMSAGDLGVSSYDVETNLDRVLEIAAKWNAVLLLDECDIFLEARSADDLDRNRIVSIFLRTLEYYEGILFLTTNRVKDMDPAFHSRIHITLEYPSLDRPARRRVWAGFLDHAATTAMAHTVTSEQVDRLAKLEINGRVIKNVLKTSNLLACHQKKPLSFEHLKTVLKVEGHHLE